MSTEDLTAADLLARLETEGIRAVTTAHRKQPIPSRLLQELIAEPEAPVLARAFIAAYPLSPSHLLEELLQVEQPPEVLAQLATNPRTPPPRLSELAAHADVAVRVQVATHPQLPGRELAALADDEAVEVRRALAGNPALRLPHQALLVADADDVVRVRLTAQPTLPRPVALALADDDCAVVQLQTVATATVEDDILENWAVSDDEAVQLALLQREELPVEVSNLLVQSPFPEVRRQAREGLDLDDIDLLSLVLEGDEEERAWVATQEVLPRALQSVLAQDKAESVRVALAGNPVLDETITRYFVGEASGAVCAALAANPVLDETQVEALAATREPAVLAALAYREDLAEEFYEFLMAHSVDFRRHASIQARHDRTITVETAQVLLSDPLPSVREMAVRACPTWRRPDLYELARDPAVAVRIAVLEHPNAADALLDDYAEDADAAVRACVKAERERRAQAVPRPAVKAAKAESSVDVDAANPSLPDPPSTRTAAAKSKRPAAPAIFNKLKRFFS
ncbi:hypothetical protein [Actomonas aquatica]|uniref:Leucine rich repeat variant n=1 Tax=Actomonas aquatica TaxID=2866162 RepID=A0ABZ1C8I0_9BACT|nr:hypothetical protein [Opitutus sp. WL0086]WRQ86625.1 hypothetical protein K1X11_017575 [Opitutus sp. WL0086]